MSITPLILIFSSFFLSIDCIEESPSILVIGSGPSGIAAASKLWKHNFTNLKILEAEPRIGGRVNSVKFGDAFVDLGGQWCHGEEDNIVYNMVKDLNILKHTTSSLRLIYSNGKFLDGEIYKNLMEFSDSIDESDRDPEIEESCKNLSSFGECFEKDFSLSNDCIEESPSILVIGSGLSGIAAATKLWKHNFTNLKILEAEPRIGGRVNSVKFGDAFVNLGGQWCHGEDDDIVYNMVKDIKLTTSSLTLIYSNGTFLDTEIYKNLMEFSDSIDAASNRNPETAESCKNLSSIGECFEKEFNSTFVRLYKDKPEKLKISLEAHDWLEQYLLVSDSSFSLNDLSLESDYKYCAGDLLLHWNGNGYKTILEIMLQEYPDKSQQLPVVANILLNKEVTKIIWSNSTAKNFVRCSDNTVYEADHVIFTPSLGVLKASHDKIFHPELPSEKVRAIRNFGFGAIMKIMLHFNTTWWNPDETYSFMWSAEDRNKILSEFGKGPIKNGRSWLTSLVVFTTADNNPKVLLAFVSGEMIPEIEKESDQVLQDGCMYMLRKFLGKKYSVVEPDNIIKSTWYSNPHFRGTYSYDSVKGNSTGSRFPEMLAAPLNRTNGYPSIQFAGEATHPYYFSTVHGAIESGYREADRIINLYRK